jgi:hypothetical protein
VDLEALRVSLGASRLDILESLDAHGALADGVTTPLGKPRKVS